MPTFRGFGTVFLAFLGLTLIVLGCTPKRPVVLPGTYSQPATPPTPTSPPTPKTTPTTPQEPRPQPAAPSGPIKEKELTQAQEPQSPPPAVKKTKEPSPQYVASIQLVQEGDRAMGKGELDSALGFYEQAVQVDGYNGLAFLGLAKVWFQKNAPTRSLEFAKKAEILLADNPKGLKETYLLESFLYEMLNQPDAAKTYKEKAQRLP